jgi:ferredoxin/flavodoxin---NADP+ reductase
MSQFHHERVLSVHHWTDRLFSFRTTRTPAFRFRSGQFVMMGLQGEGKPLLRAYSLASAHYDDELEFFSIKVPDGPLTSRLQHLKEGDEILIGRKPTGTLVTDNLKSGRTLFLLGTGTGLAPFLSIIKDPEAYEKFDRIVVAHGVRWTKDLAYSEVIANELPNDELIGELVKEKLLYYPTVTREPFVNRGRLSLALTSNAMTEALRIPPIEAAHDRFMLCGSPAMLADLRAILDEGGFEEGNHGEPGDYVIEKAFVDK